MEGEWRTTGAEPQTQSSVLDLSWPNGQSPTTWDVVWEDFKNEPAVRWLRLNGGNLLRIVGGTLEVWAGAALTLGSWGLGFVPGTALMTLGMDQILTGGANFYYSGKPQAASVAEFGGYLLGRSQGYSEQASQMIGTLTPLALSMAFGGWGWLGRRAVSSTIAGTNVGASILTGGASVGTRGWRILLGGMRIMRIGNYWIKEVNPAANWFWRWWGRMSLRAQARALARLGDMAPSFLFQNGRLIIRHAGRYTPGRFWRNWLRGSWRLRTPFNDIKRANMGALGLIFDPALNPIEQLIWAGMIGTAIGVPAWLTYEAWPLIWNDH